MNRKSFSVLQHLNQFSNLFTKLMEIAVPTIKSNKISLAYPYIRVLCDGLLYKFWKVKVWNPEKLCHSRLCKTMADRHRRDAGRSKDMPRNCFESVMVIEWGNCQVNPFCKRLDSSCRGKVLQEVDFTFQRWWNVRNQVSAGTKFLCGTHASRVFSRKSGRCRWILKRSQVLASICTIKKKLDRVAMFKRHHFELIYFKWCDICVFWDVLWCNCYLDKFMAHILEKILVAWLKNLGVVGYCGGLESWLDWHLGVNHVLKIPRFTLCLIAAYWTRDYFKIDKSCCLCSAENKTTSCFGYFKTQWCENRIVYPTLFDFRKLW